MADLTAGNVSISIVGNVLPFEQALAKARAAAAAFDAQLSGALSGGSTKAFAAAAAPAAVALSNLQKVAAPATTAVKTLNAAVSASTAPLIAATAAAKAHANAHAGLSTQAQAAMHSVRSMVEQAALGVSPMQMLTQQFGHLSFAASGPQGLSGAFKEAGTALKSIATPTVLAVGGVAALSVGAAAAVESWKSWALALDDVAKRANTTAGAMAQLQAAAGFKGIGSEDFSKGANSFSSGIYAAQNGIGSLATLLRANNLSLPTTFTDGFGKVADLIQKAGSYQQQLNLLQLAGLPATDQWVRLMQNGSAGIKAATDQTVQFGAGMDEAIKKAREFDDTISRWGTNISQGFKAATQKAIDAITGLFDVGNKFGQNGGIAGWLLRQGGVAPSLPGPSDYMTNSAPITMDAVHKALGMTDRSNDPNVQIAVMQRFSSMVAILGPLASVTDQVKAKQNELNIAYLQSGVSVGKYRDVVLDLTRYQTEAAKIQASAQVGIFAPARAAANAQLKSKVDAASGVFDPTNAAQVLAYNNASAKALQQMADNAAVAGSRFEQMTRYALDSSNVIKQVDGAMVSMGGDIENAFAAWGTGAQSAKDALKSMTTAIIGDIEKVIVRLTITGPLIKALGGAFGVGGGLGGLFGGATGAASSGAVTTGAFNTTGLLYDVGGYTGPGGKYTPAGIVHRGEVVWSQSDISRAGGVGVVEGMRLRGYADGGYVNDNIAAPDTSLSLPKGATPGAGGVTVNVNHGPIDARGADPAAITQLMKALNQRDAQMQAQLPRIIIRTVREANSRGVYLGGQMRG